MSFTVSVTIFMSQQFGKQSERTIQQKETCESHISGQISFYELFNTLTLQLLQI